MTRRTGTVLGVGALFVTLSAAGVALQCSPGDGSDEAEGPSMDGMQMDGTSTEGTSTEGTSMDEMSMDEMSMEGSIRLSDDDLGTFGITFGTADARPLSRTIRAVGIVAFDETRMVYVAPKFGGWAERLHVNFTGQQVREGQPLLDVYSPELLTAQEELLLAARMVESLEGSRVENAGGDARDLLDAARRRLAFWDISDEQVDRLVDTGEVTRTLTLYAPATGVVMEKNVFEGQAFPDGRNLYMIADLSRVWVEIEVFESDEALVREGMPVGVSVAALPGRDFRGAIEYVYPTLEERTRSMKARVVLDNPGGELKPGMYATVRLTADLGEVLTVPASAVLHSGERAVVFVDMGGGALMPHEVVVGVEGDDFVHVVEGVEAGQRVVTSAQFLLDSESNLAEVMQAMMAQMNLSDMGGMDMGDMDGDMDMSPPVPDGSGARTDPAGGN